MLILAFIGFSCDNEPVTVTVDAMLVGQWKYSHAVRGSEQSFILGTISYDFKDDKTFVKDLDAFTWRDEGTWTYDDTNETLHLTYKTYAQQVSDVQTLELTIDSITETKLVFKVPYNQNNISGEFVEFEFVHYTRE